MDSPPIGSRIGKRSFAIPLPAVANRLYRFRGQVWIELICLHLLSCGIGGSLALCCYLVVVDSRLIDGGQASGWVETHLTCIYPHVSSVQFQCLWCCGARLCISLIVVDRHRRTCSKCSDPAMWSMSVRMLV